MHQLSCLKWINNYSVCVLLLIRLILRLSIREGAFKSHLLARGILPLQPAVANQNANGFATTKVLVPLEKAGTYVGERHRQQGVS